MTLVPDLAAKLQAVARERGISFKEALNTALRRGLEPGRQRARPFRVKPRPLGLRPGIELDHALRLAAELEDGETIRKLDLRE